MPAEFEWERPIILIGAGRSGSTLASAILGEHPDIYAADETSFLLNRLWDEYFAKSEFVTNYRMWKLIKNSRDDWREMPWYTFGKGPLVDQVTGAGADLIARLEAAEGARISQSLGRFVAETLVPPELRRRFWSFKEVWNGSPSFPYGWKRHEAAFPGARYVHVIRHPWSWARSYFANMDVAPSKEDFLGALQNWVAMIDTADLQRRHEGRYFEVKFEDFKAAPIFAIRAMLAFLDLPDSTRCHIAARFKYLPSKRTVDLPQLTNEEIDAAGLRPAMERLGYAPPTIRRPLPTNSQPAMTAKISS